jgi:predicted metalloprotease
MAGVRPLRLLPLVFAAALALTGCAVVISGSPLAEGGLSLGDVDTTTIRGSDGGRIDQLAAATISDVQQYWRDQFEPTFGKPWKDLSGFFSVDTSDDDGPPPPCTDQASDVEGNAFYCSQADSIAYDRTALFPVLADKFGEAGVVVVLAHEIGHAVHNRLGITNETQRAQPNLYPTIVLESMADCYAGAVLHWIGDGKARHLRIDSEKLDLALGSLVSFRDPVGTSSGDRGAHGNAFDRVSSFQDGYQQGPQFCSKINADNRPFTLREFTDARDEASGGNLPLPNLLGAILPDLDESFGKFVGGAGGTWQTPKTSKDVSCSGDQGPIAYCPGSDGGAIALDTSSSELARLHEIGDFTTGLLLSSRFGLAALDGLGKPIEGDKAGKAALCLAGAYTGDLLGRSGGDFALSPGDLDEGVQVLLQLDYAVRDAKGKAPQTTGFDRVGIYRTGTLEGAKACDLG